MKRIPVEYAVLAIAVAATVAVMAPARAQTPSKATESTAEKIARGKYIVTTSGPTSREGTSEEASRTSSMART